MADLSSTDDAVGALAGSAVADSPAGADGGTPSPQILGEMTLSMLQGVNGHQRKEVRKLVEWLQHSLRPDVINFTNLLIAGCAPELKRTFGVPIVVTLQGDDVFLDSLPEDFRRRAIEQMRALAEHVDAFIVFNRFYASYMQQYLSLPAEKFHVVSLGINLDDFAAVNGRRELATNRSPTIGYLARLAPEKGLHLLVDAFIHLRQQSPKSTTRLLVAGWLGQQNRAYANAQFAKLRQAGLQDAFTYLGVIDRQQKLDFLGQIDVLSVPTVFQDPKGLYVLEALAAGVPVVQPAHGAFTELIESTAGGHLVPPHNAQLLAHGLQQLLDDHGRRRHLGLTGQANVAQRHTADVMASQTLNVYRTLLDR